MSETLSKLSCEAFQARLPDLIGSGAQMSDHPHFRSCNLCRALLSDLDTIAQAARQLFPIEDPPDSLWVNIKSAIVKEEAVTAEHRR
jgi:hypothetical protein